MMQQFRHSIQRSFMVVLTGIVLSACQTPPATSSNPSGAISQTLSLSQSPDGDYFYRSPSDSYLMLRKQDNTVIALAYVPQTDDGYCLQGTANGNAIEAIEAAYPPPPGEDEQWVFLAEEAIDFTQYQRLDPDDAPDYARQGLQWCLDTFAAKSEVAGQPEWTGTYTFSEVGEPNSARVKQYTVRLDPQGENYIAQIDIDGVQTMQRIRATAKPTGQNRLGFYFLDYREDSFPELYESGDLLWEWEMIAADRARVIWGAIEPLNLDNRDSFVPSDLEIQ